MYTIEVEQTGGPEVLSRVEKPRSSPGPGEVVIKAEAIGVNFVDTYFRSGLYPHELLDRVLLRGCRNPILEEVLGGLYRRIHALRRVSASATGRMTVTKQEYADLVDAIRSRSTADAVGAARQHVAAAAESAKVAMRLLEQDPDAASLEGS